MTFTRAAASVFCLALSATSIVAHAETAPASSAAKQGTHAPTSHAKYSDADLNAMIDQLSKTGKLDAVIDARIKNFVANQQAAMVKAQETEKNKKADMAKNARKVNPTRDHIFGNAKAEWSFIVYSDLECPYCKLHSGIPEAAAKLVGTDKVNVVFRHFPLPMHGENAKKEAVAAECVAKQAGNEGFFKFVNDVLKTSLLNGQGLKDGDAGISKLAAAAGAKDEAAFVSCMQDSKSTDNVREDIEDGIKAGVSGTPGNIIRNNKTGQSVAAHGYDREGETSIAAHIKSVMAGGK